MKSQTMQTDTILKFRISVYLIALAHLAVMAPRLLSKKFEESDDINLRQYSKLKWRLITSWFNFLTIAYLPLSLYCDWCTLKWKPQGKYVKIFNEIRTFLFTNLIFPITTFADILFWRLWLVNKEFLMPLSAEKYVSVWEHHCMHTVSLIFVLIDLLMVHRERPKSMLPGIVTLFGFVTVYTIMCVYSLLNGVYVYPLFRMYKGYKLVVLALYTYISTLFYYSSQWVVVDIIHSGKYISKKIKKLI